MTTTLTGTIKDGADGEFLFASDLAPESWIALPAALVATTDERATSAKGGRSVHLTLAEPTTPEGAALAQLVGTLNSALLTVAKRLPALDAGPEVEAAITDACRRCIQKCSKIVAPPDDPFAGITCMLNCADCP